MVEIEGQMGGGQFVEMLDAGGADGPLGRILPGQRLPDFGAKYFRILRIHG